MGYSFSNFDLFDTCPFAWKCRYIDKIPEAKSGPLITGGDCHTFAEKYTRHCLKKRTPQARKFWEWYDFSDTPDHLQADVKDVTKRFIESYLINIEVDALIEQKLAFTKDWKPCSWFDNETYFRAVMDLFHVEDGALGSLGVITDHKTNRKILPASQMDNAFQLKIYAFIGFLLRPDLDEIVVRFNYMRYGAVISRLEPYIKDDIADVPDIIAKKAARIEKEKKFKPVQGSRCDWCQYTAHCPLVQTAMTTVQQEHILSGKGSAQRAAAVLQMAEIATKQLKGRLKEFVDIHGPVVVGNQTLDFKVTEKLGLDAEEVTTILGSAGVSKDLIWSALGVTAAALTKALKGTGEKAALEKALASGIKKPGTKFQWIKL